MLRSRPAFLTVLAFVCAARAGVAGDFRVNVDPPTALVFSDDVAEGPTGDRFVTWRAEDGIWGRRFGSDGLPLGPSFQIQNATGAQYASVARFSDGSHVVAWDEVYVISELTGLIIEHCYLYYRLYLPDGSAAGPAVKADEAESMTCSLGSGKVVTQPDASWVIVYRRLVSGQSPQGVRAKRFPSQGNLPQQIDPEVFAVPTVAVDATGNLAVAWSTSAATNIFARLFAPDGTPVGPAFVVNQIDSGVNDATPSAAFGTAGSVLVAWDSMSSSGDDTSESIQARRFGSDGTPLGDQFQVNSLTTGIQARPAITPLPDNGYLASWQSQASYQGDGQGYSVQSRRFLADDTPAGPETQVNALETDDQIEVAAAVDASGQPFFVWTSGFDFTTYEIRGSDDRTDVGIAVTDNATTTQPGATLHYLVTVTNAGPADAPGAQVSTPFPAALSCTWSCAGTGGATCAPGPVSGAIADAASVPVGGTATYDAACLVLPDANGTLVVTATVAAPVGLMDTNTANNSATDTTSVLGLVIDDVSVPEGNSGTTTASLAVRLLTPAATLVTVDFQTGDGTATAGSDYLAASGTLSFAPGETLKTVDVTVLGDTTFEADETFFVTLSNAVGAPIVDGVGVGTILNDDSALPSGSLDELVHGSSEVRSLESAPGPLAVAQYWGIRQDPNTSYEVVVDGTSGDLGPQGPELDRLASDGTIVQRATGAGASRSLRWFSDVLDDSEQIRVQSRGCIDDCDAADVFRVRMWETTELLSRFNNSGTQITVVLLQNPTPEAVTGEIVFFTGSGGPALWQEPFSLVPGATLALNTSSIAALQGQSGSVRVASDAPYGALMGKAVAVEPATGFTFDTPLVPRPR